MTAIIAIKPAEERPLWLTCLHFKFKKGFYAYSSTEDKEDDDDEHDCQHN